MKDKYSTTQLFNFAQDSYLERTSRPVYALCFLLPFIVFYELGTVFINSSLLEKYWPGRVVAFSWMQSCLEYVGFQSKLAWVATPLAVVIILVALQMASRKKWYFWWPDIGPMVIECVLLAVPLIVLGLFLNSPAEMPDEPGPSANQAAQIRADTLPTCAWLVDQDPEEVNEQQDQYSPTASLLADIVTGIGAGIYEELAFRLILICCLMLLFQDVLRLGHSNSIVLSVLVSAALFSAYHHIDFFSGRLYQTEAFTWTEFGFRIIAGVYFAVIFAIRGFGITAGTHAFYDIIATLINAAFFGGGN